MSFGSFDNVEDALDMLDKTDFPYLLILPNRETTFLLYSNLGSYNGNVDTMKNMCESGHLAIEITKHLKNKYE